MRRLLLLLCLMPVCCLAQLEKDIDSPTEGVLTDAYACEDVMMDDLLRMLARFSSYIRNVKSQIVGERNVVVSREKVP